MLKSNPGLAVPAWTPAVLAPAFGFVVERLHLGRGFR
jgi:hypothetical protein